MEYIDILSIALRWYAIGGVVILAGSVVVYGLALVIYGLLARLGRLVSHVLVYIADRADVSTRNHRPFR